MHVLEKRTHRLVQLGPMHVLAFPQLIPHSLDLSRPYVPQALHRIAKTDILSLGHLMTSLSVP